MRCIPFILLILFIFLTIDLFSQSTTGTLKGKLVDSTSQQVFKGTSISVLNTGDSSITIFGTAKEDGSFFIREIPFGQYFLIISFLGFTDTAKIFSVTKEKPEFNAGTINFLRPPNVLTEVIVTAPLMVIKGDTTDFNASRIKTIPNATTEDLLKKLPGVEVAKDGSVKAQGETVKRVLVNGKKFFGDDPKMATKNIPADIIEKIQVIDALSDQSAFSGFDDGNRVKTINIVTKKDKKKGIFGKASVAAGNEGRYASAISSNRFSGNQQISFIAQGNNINSQNFSAQDFLGSNTGGGANVFSGNPSGLATTLAGGANYNDIWAKKTLVNASYFYNNIKSTADRDRFRETFVADDSSLFNTSEFFSVNDNKNHRLNFEIDHRFDSLNSLFIQPAYSYQENGSSSETHSYTTKGKLSPLNVVRSIVSSQNHGCNISNSILFRHRFKKTGRTFSLSLIQALNTNDRWGKNLSYNNSFAGGIDTTDQVSSIRSDGKSFGANFSLTEGLGLRAKVELSYNYNYRENNSDQQTYRLDTFTKEHSVVVPNLTNLFENKNISQQGGINYQMQINRKWNYSVGVAVQHAQLTSDNLTKGSFLDQSSYNLFPFFQIQFRETRAKNLRFIYRGSTRQPTVMQLQDLIDNSNTLHIRSGNPALKQEFTNNFNLNYNAVDIKTFKNFSLNLSAAFVSNKISNINIINTAHDSIFVNGFKLGPGVEFSKPQNLNGAFQISSFMNYSTPIKNPKSRINFIGVVNYNKDVNLVNLVKIFTNNYTLGGTVSFTMNVQEKLDFNFSSNSTYNIIRYSSNQERNGDYFTQRFSIEPTYSSKSGWIISNDFDYVMNRGQSSGFNQSVPLWNTGLAKLFLKKKQAELRLTVFDILNQNKTITRNVAQNYVEDVRTEALNRYFLVSFTYHLKKIEGQASVKK
jgi:hypothetical protein